MSKMGRLALGIGIGAILAAGCQAHTVPTSAAHATVNSAFAEAGFKSNFDGNYAWDSLKQQCAMGPRMPTTAAHERCLQYIDAQIGPYVDKLDHQRFTFDDPDRHVVLHLTNIIGVINPTAAHKVMLLTHWDTRPTADQEIGDADRAKPILGADDGASGTAVLIELARALHAQRPSVGVILLFVDGEDWGPGDDKMYLGARHFADNPGPYRPDYALLLDMIGDDNLDVYREKTSEELHPDINDKVWHAAADLGYSAQFPDRVKYQIGDDHDPMNAAGIPTVDLIDFDYAYWHTLGDTPEHCSEKSLQVVGDVMEKVLSVEH